MIMDESALFESRLELLPSILLWIGKKARQAGFEDLDVRRIELAAEEALVNIIRYAYGEQRGAIEIHIYCNGTFDIYFKDSGPFFNPTLVKRIIEEKGLDEIREGGLGIHFIRQFMDDVQYIRDDKWNILILKKKRSIDFSRKT